MSHRRIGLISNRIAKSIIARYIFISGSRNVELCDWESLNSLLMHIKVRNNPIIVGDGYSGNGVDEKVISHFPVAKIIKREGNDPRLLAKRSIKGIMTARENDAVVFCFPDINQECPKKLVPTNKGNEAFGGFKSGTWSTAAMSIGLGLPVWICSPKLPPHWNKYHVTTIDSWSYYLKVYENRPT